MKKLEYIFQRKLYDKMLQWKQEEQGQTALLIEDVRRVDTVAGIIIEMKDSMFYHIWPTPDGKNNYEIDFCCPKGINYVR